MSLTTMFVTPVHAAEMNETASEEALENDETVRRAGPNEVLPLGGHTTLEDLHLPIQI